MCAKKAIDFGLLGSLDVAVSTFCLGFLLLSFNTVLLNSKALQCSEPVYQLPCPPLLAESGTLWTVRKAKVDHRF